MIGKKLKVIVATQNKHKVEEISAMLKEFLVKKNLELIPLSDYPDPPEMREEGLTYAENATQKAEIVAQFSGEWALGDDTGLEVDVLNGQPGLYSARFSGEGASFSDNKTKLFSMMKDVPTENRTAVFRTVLALVHPSGIKHLAEGSLKGRITEEEKGGEGFGYDALFFVPELDKTFAEMTPEEKNKYSHRARAVENMKKVIEKLVSEME